MKVMPPYLWRFCAKIKTQIVICKLISTTNPNGNGMFNINIYALSKSHTLWCSGSDMPPGTTLPYPVRRIPHSGPVFGYNSHKASKVLCGKCNGFITSLATYSLGQMSEDEDMQHQYFFPLNAECAAFFSSRQLLSEISR